MTPRGTLPAGFTLVELVVAILVLSVGVLGVAATVSPINNLQIQADSRVEMTHLAQSKLEELRALAEGRQFGTELQVGGSLSQRVDGYWERVEGRSGRPFVLLWRVDDGPSSTLTLTLRVLRTERDRFVPERIDFQTRVVDR